MYPSDLSDAEWGKIESVFQVDYSKGGSPLKYSKRQMVDAIFYVAKTGCRGDFSPKIILRGKGSTIIFGNGGKLMFLKG